MANEDKKNEEIIEDSDFSDDDAEVLSDNIKKAKEQLKQCQREKQEYLTGWQRCQADFINYRRRQEEQAAEWSKMFGEGLIKDILPVLDALEPRNCAERNAEQHRDETAHGLKMVREILLKALKKHGLEEIKAAGEKFDPNFHEAVEQTESGAGECVVAEEVQKGYVLNGKVIRPAKVKVTKN